MKKRILALAVVAICISILASTTLAYFTDVGRARNVITSGGIDIEVVEQQLVDGQLRPYPCLPIPVMPGETVSKIASVQNLDEPAWIRARLTLRVYNAGGVPLNIPREELEQVIRIEPDTENWTLKDGWWYYHTAVGTGESTTPLFTQVHFSGPDMDNKYQHCTVVIDVTAQATQKANNGETVMEALGWPES